MKVRAKFTSLMESGLKKGKQWIVKSKVYDLHEREYGYEFKSEISPCHYIEKEDLYKYFENISDIKPRICEILGVKVGERFRLKTSCQNIMIDSKYYISEDGYLISENNINSPNVCIDLINGKFKIEKIPEWTDKQKEIFRALKTLGYNYIARDQNYSIFAFEKKPIEKFKPCWRANGGGSIIGLETDKILKVPHLNFIKWEDEEPFEIPEV